MSNIKIIHKLSFILHRPTVLPILFFLRSTTARLAGPCGFSSTVTLQCSKYQKNVLHVLTRWPDPFGGPPFRIIHHMCCLPDSMLRVLVEAGFFVPEPRNFLSILSSIMLEILITCTTELLLLYLLISR